MASKKDSELMGAYVAEQEQSVEAPVSEAPMPERRSATITPVKQPERTMAEIAHENRTHGREDVGPLKYKDNLGWLKVPVDSLPTAGIFYEDGMEISIRAARGEEIKHWSTMNDQDIQQLSRVDDILNYMIERCVSVKREGVPGNCWKDLKNVDRFYILLAIQEFTFPNGENELKVPYGEGQELTVRKEMVDFINIPEDIRRFYNHDERCFVFNVGNRPINIHIPSIGVNDWLKKYAINKTNAREPYDEDFLQFAPMLIRDYRALTVKDYEEMVAASRMWGVKEWSVISHVTEKLSSASDPKIKYIDDGGVEKEVPLTFRGGIRSLFVIPDPLQSIC